MASMRRAASGMLTPSARQLCRSAATSLTRSPHSGPKLVFERAADGPGQARRQAVGGDGQQQVAAPHLGHRMEIAIIRHVLDIHQHAQAAGEGGEFEPRVPARHRRSRACAAPAAPPRPAERGAGKGRPRRRARRSGASANSKTSVAPAWRRARSRRSARAPFPATARFTERGSRAKGIMASKKRIFPERSILFGK